MYSQGESFDYTIDGDEFELTVLETLIIRDKEYLITEDFDGAYHVFLYDEEYEELEHIDDINEANSILDYWKDEYGDSEDLGDWDDDSYYDREDSYDKHDFYPDSYNDNEDYY